MLAERNPHAAYSRVELDARIAGAGPEDLVRLCFERLVEALGGALRAAERADNKRKSDELARALAALTALQLGVAEGTAISPALTRLYDAARRTVLDSVLHFDAGKLTTLRADFREIAAALTGR